MSRVSRRSFALLATLAVAGLRELRASDASPVADTLRSRGLAFDVAQLASDWIGWRASYRFRCMEFGESEDVPDSFRDGVLLVDGDAAAVTVEEVCRARDAESPQYVPRRKVDHFCLERGESASLLSSLGSGHDSIVLYCGCPLPNWLFLLRGVLEPKQSDYVVTDDVAAADGSTARELTFDSATGVRGRLTYDVAAGTALQRVELLSADKFERHITFLDPRPDPRSGRMLPTTVLDRRTVAGKLKFVGLWERVDVDRAAPGVQPVAPDSEVLDFRVPGRRVASARTDRPMPIGDLLAWTASAPDGPAAELASAAEAASSAPQPRPAVAPTESSDAKPSSWFDWHAVALVLLVSVAGFGVARKRGAAAG